MIVYWLAVGKWHIQIPEVCNIDLKDPIGHIHRERMRGVINFAMKGNTINNSRKLKYAHV